MLIDIHPYYQRFLTDWGEAKKKVNQGVWVKAAEGNVKYTKQADGKTWTADRHIKGAKSVGLPTGVYGWAYSSQTPESQAERLVDEAERTGATELRPFWDVEDSTQWYPNTSAGRAKVRDYCERWAARVIKLGHKPAIYYPASWARVLRPASYDIPDQCIIIARYGANNGGVSANPEDGDLYTGRYDVHQYTSVGRVPGYSGYVDLNRTKTNRYLNNKTQEWDEMATKAEIGEVVEAKLRAWDNVKNLVSNTDSNVKTLGQWTHKHVVDIKALVTLLADDEGKLTQLIKDSFASIPARDKATAKAAFLEALYEYFKQAQEPAEEPAAA